MEYRIWLSYDLSVNGDYEGLYAWLDDHDAKECGDSVACFWWNDDGTGEISKQIKESILSRYEPDKKKDRIYIIYRIEDAEKTIIRGKFILGSRKTSPWRGFGSRVEEEDDDEPIM